MRGNVVTLFRRYPNSAFIDFTQSVSPTRAIPYDTGETYKFTRQSTVWCQAYDTATASLKWVEIPANVPPMPGMRWDAVSNLWSPYDDNGVLIPEGFRKGYWYLPQATNSLAYSRDFTNEYWNIHSSISISKNAIGFDGSENGGCTLTDTDINATGLLQKNVSVSSDDLTNSAIFIWAKDDDETRFPGSYIIYSGGSSTRYFSVFINTKTGDNFIGFNSDPSTNYYNVLDMGDSWAVALFGKNISANNNTTMGIRVDPAGSAEFGSVTLAVGSAVLQNIDLRLNTTFYDGSPIVTNGNAATRLAGDYRLSIANHNQAAGMVLLELEHIISTSLYPAGNQFIVNVNDSGDRRNVLYATANTYSSWDGSVAILSDTTSPKTVGTVDKIAVRWSENAEGLIVNGNEKLGSYDGNFSIHNNIVLFLNNGTTIPYYLKKLKYYKVDRGTAWIQGQQS